MPEEIDWDYQTVTTEKIRSVREYLYRRRKEGWKLFYIEGRKLHFRRRKIKKAA